MLPVILILLTLAGQPEGMSGEDYSLLDSYAPAASPQAQPMTQHTRYIRQPNTPFLAAPGGDTLAVLAQSAPVHVIARQDGYLEVLVHGPCVRDDLVCTFSDRGQVPAGRCTTSNELTLFDPRWTAAWRDHRYRTDIATLHKGTMVQARPGDNSHLHRIFLGGWVSESAATSDLESTKPADSHPVFGNFLEFKEMGDSTVISGHWLAPRRTPAPETYEVVLFDAGGLPVGHTAAVFRPESDPESASGYDRFTATIPTPGAVIASCEILAGTDAPGR